VQQPGFGRPTGSWPATPSVTCLIVALGGTCSATTVAGLEWVGRPARQPAARVLPNGRGAAWTSWAEVGRAPTPDRPGRRSARSAAQAECASTPRARLRSITLAAARPLPRCPRRVAARCSTRSGWCFGPGSWFTSVLPPPASARARLPGAWHGTTARRLVVPQTWRRSRGENRRDIFATQAPRGPRRGHAPALTVDVVLGGTTKARRSGVSLARPGRESKPRCSGARPG